MDGSASLLEGQLSFRAFLNVSSNGLLLLEVDTADSFSSWNRPIASTAFSSFVGVGVEVKDNVGTFNLEMTSLPDMIVL